MAAGPITLNKRSHSSTVSTDSSESAPAPADAQPGPLVIAHRLRALRRQRRLTLRVLAERTGLSQGFLSQAERGHSMPSIGSLQRIAAALETQITYFFDDHDTRPVVLRAHERTRLLTDLERVNKFVLTAHPLENLEVLLCVLEPGGSTSRGPASHGPSDEFVIVLRGIADFEVGGQLSTLEEGDCITYSSSIPHRATNNSSAMLELLYAISPPSF